MESRPREETSPSDERLYLTGEISASEYNARLEAKIVAGAESSLRDVMAERSKKDDLLTVHWEDPQIILPREI